MIESDCSTLQQCSSIYSICHYVHRLSPKSIMTVLSRGLSTWDHLQYDVVSLIHLSTWEVHFPTWVSTCLSLYAGLCVYVFFSILISPLLHYICSQTTERKHTAHIWVNVSAKGRKTESERRECETERARWYQANSFPHRYHIAVSG